MVQNSAIEHYILNDESLNLSFSQRINNWKGELNSLLHEVVYIMRKSENGMYFLNLDLFKGSNKYNTYIHYITWENKGNRFPLFLELITCNTLKFIRDTLYEMNEVIKY